MKKILLASVAGLLISAPVFAAENQAYAAFDAGQSTASNSCDGVPATVACKKTDTAYRIAAGYGFTRNFGAEVSYTDYGKARLSGTVGAVAVVANAGATAFQIVGTGVLPLSQNFSLTAKLGFASVSTKANATAVVGPFSVAASTSATNNNAVFGIGAEYAFTPAISGRLNYEDLGTIGDAATMGKSKLTSVTAGLVVNF
ncbi:MAG TPA: hypothetical protein DE312_01810 [Gallionella sp.]|jgi:OOP family OmpA-OmpF porin|nr:outer membrane beta-barrel protein [Gallionella sp.]OGS67260.1 MAG: hypothetical protein A2Z87_03485 [Gallionellales bacterium GWA2_54_124]HCI52061.1 hypothetical protein [Gallionella sp.]